MPRCIVRADIHACHFRVLGADEAQYSMSHVEVVLKAREQVRVRSGRAQRSHRHGRDCGY
jgi:hypothetical protein